MTLQGNRELEVTQEKLLGLEQLYAQTESSPAENAYVKDLTLRSLRRTINQLKEEIARFQARASSGTSSK